MDDDGVMTAVSPGSATVTAVMGDLSDTVEITVYMQAESFELSTSEAWVVEGNGMQLTVLPVPPEAEVVCSWESSDESVAYVTQEGRIGTWKSGDVIITVTGGSCVRTCLLHVCPPVTDIRFEEEQLSAVAGTVLQLTANVSMGDLTCVNHLVTFASSDETVATVDPNGRVTAIRGGTATITAKAGSGVSASCTVTVRDLVYASLPGELKVIEEEAFAGAAFEAVVIPTGVTSIESRAFAGCPNLIRVRIPEGVLSIAEDAFEGCREDLIIERD